MCVYPAFVLTHPASAAPPGEKVLPHVAEDLRFETLAGDTVPWHEASENAALVIISTTCAACRESFHAMWVAAKRLNADATRTVVIDGLANALAFAAAVGLNSSEIWVPVEDDGVRRPITVSRVPTLLWLEDGTVIASRIGRPGPTWALEARLARLMHAITD